MVYFHLYNLNPEMQGGQRQMWLQGLFCSSVSVFVRLRCLSWIIDILS